MVIFGVGFEMLSEIDDPFGQESNLDFWGNPCLYHGSDVLAQFQAFVLRSAHSLFLLFLGCFFASLRISDIFNTAFAQCKAYSTRAKRHCC